VFLGETGIFCRMISGEGEVAVGAGVSAPAAISLYPF